MQSVSTRDMEQGGMVAECGVALGFDQTVRILRRTGVQFGRFHRSVHLAHDIPREMAGATLGDVPREDVRWENDVAPQIKSWHPSATNRDSTSDHGLNQEQIRSSCFPNQCAMLNSLNSFSATSPPDFALRRRLRHNFAYLGVNTHRA